MLFVIKSIGLFLFSALFCLALVPFVKRFGLRYGFVDVPGERRIHHKVTPRIGGLAMFVTMMVVLVGLTFFTQHQSNLFHLVLWGVPLAFALGFWDDLKGIGSKKKLGVQFLLGLLCCYFDVRLEALSLGEGFEISLGFLSYPLTVFWVMLAMNALNLIDGVDGLASGVSFVAFSSLAVVFGVLGFIPGFILALVGSGVTLGFLVYNYHPAQIFMGDSGSMVLGFLLSVLTLLGREKNSQAVLVWVPFLVMLYPLFDTHISILRRTIATLDEVDASKTWIQKSIQTFKNIVTADGNHVHHRLLTLYQSNVRVFYTVVLLSLVACSLAVISFFLPSMIVFSLLTLLGLGLFQFTLSLEYTEFLPKEQRLEAKEHKWRKVFHS